MVSAQRFSRTSYQSGISPHRNEEYAGRDVDGIYETVNPTKEEIREYMARRRLQRQPLPSQAEIRHQLGWRLIRLVRQPAVCAESGWSASMPEFRRFLSRLWHR